MTTQIDAAPLEEQAPERPPQGPLVWLRENMFSSLPSGIMSVVAIAIVLAAVRGLLAFVFDPTRRWDAVTFNTRLLMVQAYPQGQSARVWISVGIVVVLLAATLAFYRLGGRLAAKKVGTVLMAVGGSVAVAGILGPFSTSATVAWVAVGVVVLAAGFGLRRLAVIGRVESVPVLGIVLAALVVGLAVIWTIDLPVPAKIVDGVEVTTQADAALAPAGSEQTIVFRPIATTTTGPWTILALLGVAVYWLVKLLRGAVPRDLGRSVLLAAWVVSFPLIVLVILRDPDLDYGKFFSFYVPVALGFAVVGGLALFYFASARAGEAGKALAALLFVIALGSFLVSVPFLIRFLLLFLAVFALAAPTFGSHGGSRRSFLAIWVGLVLVASYLFAIITAPSTIEVPGNFFLGGLALTLLLSITTIVASFPLGVLLALARTSTMPIFRMLATGYIEVVRGVPLITWLLVMFLMFPVALPEGIEVGGVVRAIMAMTFFSAAYLAENVRGGLQSVGRGQVEASKALGMSVALQTVFITLPQALRAVIPAIVGQVIALFKDTSLVTIVGLFDLLHIARQVIPAQSQPFSFLGSIKETLLFVAVVYWVFTFTFSRISLRLEKRLGVGER